MKKKTASVLSAMRAITLDNLGFLIVWIVSLAVILKLACV
jgi:hypothetical protein